MAAFAYSHEDLKEVFVAGQTFLRAIHGLCTDRDLEAFDRYLQSLYQSLGITSKLCDSCDADCPVDLLRSGGCPNCLEGNPMKATTTEIARAAKVERQAAYGLVTYLKALGLAKEAGTVAKEPGAKGRAENIYEIDGDAVVEHFKGLI